MMMAAGSLILAGCAPSPAHSVNAGVVRAVAAENQYGSVIQQIGGRYVSVISIMNNPSIDPHTYEADSRDAIALAKASLVVQNGAGYDGFMTKLESATSGSRRTVIDVAQALGYGSRVKNPHFWYSPQTMPKVARQVDRALSRLQPDHQAYFARNLKVFDQSLGSWSAALSLLKKQYPGAPVAVTEPVADYLLKAAGMDIKTPWAFQAAVMNGTDPSPQAVQIEENLLRDRKVRVFVYNRQAVDSTTTALVALAKQHGVPVVGVYETMPLHLTYQRWMVAETKAVNAALKTGKSTVTMP